MVSINCDMGESFGLYRLGCDADIMPHITFANVACGLHASDPNHMYETVQLAKQHEVKIGAHFSLPDLQGFGRREMVMTRKELFNFIVYQIGALSGFLKTHQVAMTHLKPHGALYGMAAKYEHVAHAVADAAQLFELPVFGMSNTLHEEVFTARGVEFVPEFFVDLDYGDAGELIITREHEAVTPERAVALSLRAIRDHRVTSINGKDVALEAQTVCVHSDTPGAVEVVKAVRAALTPYMTQEQSDA